MLDGHGIETALIASSGLVRGGLAAVLKRTRFTVVSATEYVDGSGELSCSTEGVGLIIAAIESLEQGYMLLGLAQSNSDSKLVLLLRPGSGDLLPHGLPEVASGILDINVSGEVLVSALDLVLAGLSIRMPRVADASVGYATPDYEAGSSCQSKHEMTGLTAQSLSPREKDVLRALSVGASNKLIARDYDLAEATVKIHVKNVLRKLKAQNRTQAAIWARENGFRARVPTCSQAPTMAS